MAALGAPIFLALWLFPMADPTGGAGGGPDPLTVLVNYGGLAGAFALVIIGRLRTPAEVTALNARIDSLEARLKERDDTIEAKDSLISGLTQAVTLRTIPAMAGTREIIEQIPQTESALAQLLRESLAKTEALTARLDARGDLGRESPKGDER